MQSQARERKSKTAVLRAAPMQAAGLACECHFQLGPGCCSPPRPPSRIIAPSSHTERQWQHQAQLAGPRHRTRLCPHTGRSISTLHAAATPNTSVKLQHRRVDRRGLPNHEHDDEPLEQCRAKKDLGAPHAAGSSQPLHSNVIESKTAGARCVDRERSSTPRAPLSSHFLL